MSVISLTCRNHPAGRWEIRGRFSTLLFYPSPAMPRECECPESDLVPTSSTCRHCGRTIVLDRFGFWTDPEATGDDAMWRETCDQHDTFTADHEPVTS